MRLHSLTTRFVLTLLLSILVPFLVLGWFAVGGVQRLEERVVQVMLADHAERVAERIYARLDVAVQDCLPWLRAADECVHNPDWGLGSDDPAEATTAPFDDAIYRTGTLWDAFHLVLLADSSGDVVYFLRSDDQLPLGVTAQLDPGSVVGESWFHAAEAGETDITTGCHLSPFMHATPDKSSKDPGDYGLGFAFGLWDAGFEGVVYALLDWSVIQSIIDTARDDLEEAGYEYGHVVICDADGRAIAHSDRAQYDAQLEPVSLREAVLHSVTPVTSYFDGEARRAGTARVPSRDDWHLAITLPESELFGTSREFRRTLIAVSTFIAVVLVAWSLLASRRILRPVYRLGEATERIASGDLSTRVPAEGRDELADLGRAFNSMAEDLEASENQLRVAERHAAWAEMARQVAHEIKNPLTPMQMSAQLLLRAHRDGDPRLPELIERLGRSVLEQTEALARIASDFRQFAGPPDRSMATVEVGELLAGAEREFAAPIEAGARLSFSSEVSAAKVRVDRLELRRVFVNLIQNALSAAGSEGAVVVSCEADGEDLRFSVRDDGPGIPEELRERLFEPYFTTRSGGTGLGLAICRRILEAHGGSIRLAESGPSGSRFEFSLPRASAAGEAGEPTGP